ncbi:hypothetical protein F3N42_00970 [Marinihelvus fidelis]|uniref:Uncharacterized protein n=2 Tax=Marinihelvus fidelis TaxID=2613842 RepID=A0A5N0TJQ0_9GAMM|nr:hypothetical protein F3N42_00970 [Marinihelvus fidelis]
MGVTRACRLIGLLVSLLPLAALAESLPWVDRPDAMHATVLADVDATADRVRLLYQTMPSMEQRASGNWAINVYLAELYADGRVENHRLATGQRYFDALSLQRGGDGVFVAVMPSVHGGDRVLEYWSAADGSVRSSVVLPLLGSAAPGLFPTDDGHFFVIVMSARSARGDESNSISVVKYAATGQELARAEWGAVNAASGPAGGYAMPGGGMGVMVNMHLVKGGRALGSSADAVQQFDVGGRIIEARVFAETRLLSFDASGQLAWESPALERELTWGGALAIPQDQPMNVMLAQNEEQMALVSKARLDSGGDRQIEHHVVSGYDDVQPTANGFSMLVDVSADRDLQPPVHGVRLLELGLDGRVQRELRIEPAAERLQATFEQFLPMADGGLLVAGTRRGGLDALHVTRLSADGDIAWTTTPASADVIIEGLADAAGTAWVFGQGWNPAANRNQLWAQRVGEDQAVPVPPAPEPEPPAANEPAAAQSATAQPAAVPIPELPEPTGDCSCSCEEFELFQQTSKALETASQADLLATVNSPAYQSMMSCMGGCAMQYMSCQ